MLRSLAITVFLIIAAPLVSADALLAGAAQSVITPELPKGDAVYLAGFGHNRVASGVHDDLYARCLALATARETLVICSADLIGLFYDDVLTVRREFQQKTATSSFLIVASTHTGPVTLGLCGPSRPHIGIDRKYLDWMDRRIAATAATPCMI